MSRKPRPRGPPEGRTDELDDGDADNESEGEDTGRKPASCDVPPKKRAARNSHGVLEPSPRTMVFYRDDAAWTDILESAKNEYRLYIHKHKAFPVRNLESLQRAGLCVTEAITAHMNDPDFSEDLDDSKFSDLQSVQSSLY
jgi:hypothetical protein